MRCYKSWMIILLGFLASPALANEKGGGGLLSPNPGLAIWTILTFVFVLVVLKIFAWKPLITSLENRTNSIEQTIKDADERYRKAEDLLKNHEARLEKSKGEALELLDEGKKDGEKRKKEIVEEAQKEATALKKQAKKEIELATKQAKDEIWKMAVELSTTLAEKIMGKTLDAAQDKKIIQDILAEYERN